MENSLQRVCIVIARTRHRMVAMEIQQAARAGAKLLEIRLDFISRAPDLRRLLENKPCPIIATIRRREDGGRWTGSEDARKTLLRQCIVGGFDWIDLETDVADEIPRFGPTKRIVSYHNIEGVPENLEEIYDRMCQQDADVVKIAVTAQEIADNGRVLNLLKNAEKPTIAHCMGDLGFPTRLLGLKFGAPFVYAAFNEDRMIAPGMPTMWELQHSFPIDQVNADTQFYGVIGDPVAHSLSPTLHNRLFRRSNVNALYLPFRVPRGQLEAHLQTYMTVPVRGYSVTIPHKEAAAQVAKQASDVVQQTHAANTLILRSDGKTFEAHNTDYQAVLDTLLSALPPGEDDSPPTLEGKMVLLLGAGGVARAIAHALKKAGSVLTISNRSPEKAHRLAAEVEGRVLDWMARHTASCDIIINATSLGMHPNVDDIPIHAGFFQPNILAFDTVYNPETTLFIKEARLRGCKTVTGVEFFVRQAAFQFELFTGMSPDLEEMRRIVRRALSPVTHIEEDDGDDRTP
jgi:3-dehydroquinate dehydratase/shikimate dehydrogenase